jgi:hypothetical protein
MTIRTTDFAFGNFCFNRTLAISLINHVGDILYFVPSYVVEI